MVTEESTPYDTLMIGALLMIPVQEVTRRVSAALLQQGFTGAGVARLLGVHCQSVTRWAKALKRGGRSGLRRAPRAGRPSKRNEAEIAQLEQCLKQGPEQFGYLSGLWTLARVGKLIEQQHGVRYDASQVWRILRKLNWSCQRPTGRARERDEKAIQQWKKVRWPQLKKKRSRGPHYPLHRRKRIERTAASRAHLGAARANAGAAIPFQLEGAVSHGRHHLAEFLLPPLSRHHPHRPSAEFPGSSAAPFARQAITHLGPPATAPRTSRTRVCGRPRRPAGDRVPAQLRARTQPGRVSVGLLETPRLAQLLPG